MASKTPNILLLFTDMQRADTIGALGNPVIQTPNLDRLAREGTAFTSAFTPSPVCVSARCSLQYGRYPDRTGCSDNSPMPADDGTSWPARLASAGYHTAAVGKCHFTPDGSALRGFHERVSQEEGVGPGGRDDYRDWLSAEGLFPREPFGMRGEMYYIPQPSHLDEKHHGSTFIADRSLEYIHRRRKEGGPWALFSSFIHPHPPFTPPIPWHKRYRSPEMPLPHLPEGYGQVLTAINRIQNRYKYRDQGLDMNLLRSIKAYYYACISFVDHQVGRILADLEAHGELDDTLMVFTSDHGEFLGDFGSFGKRSMHDPSSRIPMLARHPASFPAGRLEETPVSLVDVLPTFARAAGADVDAALCDGRALQDVVEKTQEREVFSQWSSGASAQYMLVDRRHKYFYSAADHREFLFDRRLDPKETRSRAGLASHKPVLKALRAKLFARLLRNGEHPAIVRDAKGEPQWREYPAHERAALTAHLDDPDAGLLAQDEYRWGD